MYFQFSITALLSTLLSKTALILLSENSQHNDIRKLIGYIS